MKRILLLCSVFIMALGLCNAQSQINVNAEEAKKSYQEKFKITPMNKTVTIIGDKVIISPKKEDQEYTISGYFCGQIVNRTKNTVINLDNVYLENTNGEAAIYGDAKFKLSAERGTTNYIVSTGENSQKGAALQCKKNMVIGGSGTLYVLGSVYHGAKADDVKIKGSGNFYFKGTSKGAALSCHNLTVEAEKTFNAYFLDSKNGIKADETINIASGNFYLYGNSTGLKTDTLEDSAEVAHGITLKAGTFHIRDNDTFYETDAGKYSAGKAKIIEE